MFGILFDKERGQSGHAVPVCDHFGLALFVVINHFVILNVILSYKSTDKRHKSV